MILQFCNFCQFQPAVSVHRIVKILSSLSRAHARARAVYTDFISGGRDKQLLCPLPPGSIYKSVLENKKEDFSFLNLRIKKETESYLIIQSKKEIVRRERWKRPFSSPGKSKCLSLRQESLDPVLQGLFNCLQPLCRQVIGGMLFKPEADHLPQLFLLPRRDKLPDNVPERNAVG